MELADLIFFCNHKEFPFHSHGTSEQGQATVALHYSIKPNEKLKHKY